MSFEAPLNSPTHATHPSGNRAALQTCRRRERRGGSGTHTPAAEFTVCTSEVNTLASCPPIRSTRPKSLALSSIVTAAAATQGPRDSGEGAFVTCVVPPHLSRHDAKTPDVRRHSLRARFRRARTVILVRRARRRTPAPRSTRDASEVETGTKTYAPTEAPEDAVSTRRS